MSQSNIGVFICHCGDNISKNIDMELLKQKFSVDDLSCIVEHDYLCSVEGQHLIHNKVESLGLDGLIIAACSPEIHQGKFRDFAEDAGVNRYLVDIANIREQCAWVSKDPEPTTRAVDIIRSSIFAVRNAEQLEKIILPVVKSVVVIGGGISGITAALSLARQNIKVFLVEKTPTIGGNMVKIGKVYSSDTMSEECAMCSLAPLMGEVNDHPLIEILTMSSVSNITGHRGDFKIKVITDPLMVNGNQCTSCGECSRVCGVCVLDEWNANLLTRKAIYKPFPGAVPRSYTVDTCVCVKCGACVEACTVGAINLECESTERILNAGAIIIATGHNELDPGDKEEYGYHKFSGVITQMELARILAVNGPTDGQLRVPGDDKSIRRLVMVQCVGSRDRKPGSIPYCSTVCCMVALKHANYISNHFKGVEVFICYTDMKTLGKYEDYYFETQKNGEKNLRFIRGRVAEVLEDLDDKLVVRVEDTLGEGLMEVEADMVVLSCAIKPSDDAELMESIFDISLNEEYFVMEKHPKLEPTQTTVPGIFVCGTARGGMDITDSINMARSAASNVMELMSSDTIEIEPKYAMIDNVKCIECGECVDFCSSGAIYINPDVFIDPFVCSGDGGCIGNCPQNAIYLPGCSDMEIFARIQGSLSSGEPLILAFLDEKIAYVAADNIGVNRRDYPVEVRIIRISSIMRLELKHILYAFENGAVGIFLGDGTGNASGSQVKEKLEDKVEEMKSGVASALIDPDRIWFYEAYLPHYKGLASNLKEFRDNLKKYL